MYRFVLHRQARVNIYFTFFCTGVLVTHADASAMAKASGIGQIIDPHYSE
jgi:hypothetical protein